MGIPITTVGSTVNFGPPQEFSQDRTALRLQHAAQARAAENRAAAFERFESSLPGNRETTDKNPQVLRVAAAELEQISLAFNKKLKFVVDHESNEITVKVIDGATDKVIKILPPEELQRLHSKIREAIGFFFDERV